MIKLSINPKKSSETCIYLENEKQFPKIAVKLSPEPPQNFKVLVIAIDNELNMTTSSSSLASNLQKDDIDNAIYNLIGQIDEIEYEGLFR